MNLSLPNISQGNTVRIRTDEQNLWDKKGIVIKQTNRPRSYDVLNENGNVMIRNRRHLISTNKKFTEKFSYSISYHPPLDYQKGSQHRKRPIRQKP